MCAFVVLEGTFYHTHACELRKVLFLALSVNLFIMYEIYREPLNGFGQIETEDVFDPSLGRV